MKNFFQQTHFIGLSMFLLVAGISCRAQVDPLVAPNQITNTTSGSAFFAPSGINYTPETINLYNSLQRVAPKGVMFGHQDDLATGVGWTYTSGRSDTKEIVGEYPAVVGGEMGNLELNLSYNADGINFAKMKATFQQVYAQGGVVSLLWGLNNPVDTTQTRKSTMDSTITKLLQSPVAIARYQRWMQTFAQFLKDLKGANGEAIPVVLRILHEQNGNWYWWGRTHCTVQEYTTMYKWTVNYLRDTANVRNVLFAYCPNAFTTEAEYLERYPGDAYVDILAVDFYDNAGYHNAAGNGYISRAKTMIPILKTQATQRHKIYAFTETGLTLLPLSDWFTQSLLPAIKNSGLSFALVWRNARTDAFYSSYVGHASAPDFQTFHQDTTVLFQNKIAQEELYKPH